MKTGRRDRKQSHIIDFFWSFEWDNFNGIRSSCGKIENPGNITIHYNDKKCIIWCNISFYLKLFTCLLSKSITLAGFKVEKQAKIRQISKRFGGVQDRCQDGAEQWDQRVDNRAESAQRGIWELWWAEQEETEERQRCRGQQPERREEGDGKQDRTGSTGN